MCSSDLGRTGVLARSGEPAALADALEQLLASADLRREVARAGHERFLAEFTDQALQRRFFEGLERAADRSGAPTGNDG